MLRRLVLVLLLANLGFFAWTRGWLAPWLPPPADGREPQRLAQQLHPQRIAVLSAGAASAALAAAAVAAASAPPEAEPPVLCLEAGPFNESTAQAALALLAEHGVAKDAVQRELVARNVTWGVVIAPLADREVLRTRAAELTRLQVRFDEITTPTTLVPGLRLGNFSDRYGAETALARLVAKGVREARVAPLPLGASQQWLRVPRADAELQTRLESLPSERLERVFQPCTERPPPA